MFLYVSPGINFLFVGVPKESLIVSSCFGAPQGCTLGAVQGLGSRVLSGVSPLPKIGCQHTLVNRPSGR
jgi:hypothetical protein